MTGKNLGHYTIEIRLGAGGFGEVYRARDTRLGRNVAVKLLPEVFAENPERIEKFEREARVLASLNHPGIAALYGVETFENVRFLVMELAEGETLAERIARGPIPAAEALAIVRQIAEALEAAHDKGIVHRDLKPGNVKVTLDGKVKVLDFGLARAMRVEPDPALTAAPTRSMSGTFAGLIQGTPAYMSPEQAKGLEGDARSDIFSFGCVLYEMLTGRQPFEGDTLAEVMAGVIARAPDLSALPVNLNPRILELLRRCLEKDPRRRWQAVASVRVEIEAILADPRGVALQNQADGIRRPLWRRAIPAAAGILVGGVIAALAAWSLKPPPVNAVTRFTFPATPFSNAGRQVLDIAPDETQFVYVAANILRLRPMGELDAFPIPLQNISMIVNPVFSPDGKSIVFWGGGGTERVLKRVSVSGGAPVTLCPADAPFGITWAENDRIVFGQGAKGILQVSANGGKPDVLVAAQNGEILHGPQILPGGKAILFTALAGTAGAGQWDQAKIFVQPLPSGDRKILIEDGTDARYLPTGHLIYFLGGNLLAVPFDLMQLAVTGRPAPVVEGVRFSNNDLTGTAQFSISRAGTLVYVPTATTGAPSASTTVTIVDSSGGGMPLPLPANPYVSARVSPDGKQLAVGTDDGKEANIWVYDLSGKAALTRLTLSGRNLYPVWSGDSKRILFQSDREKDLAVFWQLADGTGRAERLTKPEPGNSHLPESWLPGQQKFSYRDAKSEDIWIHSMESKDDKKDAPLIVVPGSNQYDSTFSPDGHWIAYRSREAGKAGIYVEPYPTTGARYLLGVNENIAWAPAWAPDSKSVYFHRQAAGQLHAFALQIQPTFQHLNTVDFPINQFRHQQNYRMYDVLPDGNHFVVIRNAQQGIATATAASPPEIKVVINWFEDLKKLAARP